MTGPRWNTEAARRRRAIAGVLAVAACAALVPSVRPARAARAVAVDDWLVPGLDLREVAFEAGAWCRYRVVDEADGVRDTTVVDVSVPVDGAVGGAPGRAPRAWWIEFASGPPGADETARDVLRVLVDADIARGARGDSLSAYVRGYWVRRAGGRVEPGDLAELDRLTLDAGVGGWGALPDTVVTTPAGRFVCRRRVRTRLESRRRRQGRVTVIVQRRDRWTLLLCDAVPLFRLVRCRVDRLRESRTEPRLRGIPDPGPRRSHVVTELVATGRGARSRLTVTP